MQCIDAAKKVGALSCFILRQQTNFRIFSLESFCYGKKVGIFKNVHMNYFFKDHLQQLSRQKLIMVIMVEYPFFLMDL